MTGMTERFRTLIPLGALIAVIAASAVLWHNLPTPSAVYAPFDQPGAMGTPVSGRGISATVTRASIADRLTDTSSRDRQPVTATGRWVVVDATLTATTSPDRPHAELIVGPNTYAPSDRFSSTSWVRELAPGMPMTGPWVFDVAPAVLDASSTKELVLHLWVGDGRLDSRLVIAIPLAGTGIGRYAVVDLQPVRAAS